MPTTVTSPRVRAWHRRDRRLRVLCDGRARPHPFDETSPLSFFFFFSGKKKLPRESFDLSASPSSVGFTKGTLYHIELTGHVFVFAFFRVL